MARLNASIGLDDGKTYFFVEDTCICHNFFSNELEPGYPKPIASVWKGVWSNIDAVVRGQGTRANKLYFFKGNQYLRYDLTVGKIDPGYPASIAVWKGLWSDGVEAAITLPTNGKIYFFRGSEYIRYDFDKGTDPGYPKQISAAWKGVWNNFETVCMGQGDRANKAYFFKGDQYIRYDVKTSTVDSGYPQPRSVWAGLVKGLDILSSQRQRKVRIQLLDVYCHETEDIGFIGVGSEDELTVIWGGLFGTTGVSGEWLTDIDNGDRIAIKPREKSVLFDGTLPNDQIFELYVALFDRDSGDQWRAAKSKIEKYVKTAASIATTIGTAAATSGASTASSAESGLIAKVASDQGTNTAAGIIAGIISAIGGLDSDDFLGEDQIYSKVASLPAGEKDHKLRFTGDGANYTVRVRTTVA